MSLEVAVAQTASQCPGCLKIPWEAPASARLSSGEGANMLSRLPVPPCGQAEGLAGQGHRLLLINRWWRTGPMSGSGPTRGSGGHPRPRRVPLAGGRPRRMSESDRHAMQSLGIEFI